MKPPERLDSPPSTFAFTLIEFLVVIAIIAITTFVNAEDRRDWQLVVDATPK